MNPLRIDKNKTTIFVLPLAVKGFTDNQIITDDFINAYIADIDKPEWDDYVILVYDREVALEDIAKASYKYEDYFLYVINIPDDLLADYFQIIQGKYTEISEKAKQRILQFWSQNEDSKLYKILYGMVESKLGDGIRPEKVKELMPPFRLYEEVYGMGSNH